MDTDTRKVASVGMRAFNNVEHHVEHGGQRNATSCLHLRTKEILNDFEDDVR